jgi:hypothetical protein
MIDAHCWHLCGEIQITMNNRVVDTFDTILVTMLKYFYNLEIPDVRTCMYYVREM